MTWLIWFKHAVHLYFCIMLLQWSSTNINLYQWKHQIWLLLLYNNKCHIRNCIIVAGSLWRIQWRMTFRIFLHSNLSGHQNDHLLILKVMASYLSCSPKAVPYVFDNLVIVYRIVLLLAIWGVIYNIISSSPTKLWGKIKTTGSATICDMPSSH